MLINTPYRKRQSAGFSLIELLIVVAIIGIIAAIAIPNVMMAKRSAHETSAIAIVKSLIKAESMYFSSYGNQVTYGTLNNLVTNNCIEDSLLAGARNSYLFQITLSSPVAYSITATPSSDPAGQMRHFYGDETGIIRQALGTAATATSPPVN